MEIKVVGFDPSLRHWGVSSGVFHTEQNKLEIVDVDVLEPSLPTGKQVRANSKDLAAAYQLAKGAGDYAKGAQAIFVEVPHGSQSARAMAGYGICVGVLGSLLANDQQFYQLSERELKLATLGKTKGSKQEAIDWATSNWPNAPWSTYTRNGEVLLSAAKVEHQADACAAIYAGIQSKEFLQTLKLMSNVNENSIH